MSRSHFQGAWSLLLSLCLCVSIPARGKSPYTVDLKHPVRVKISNLHPTQFTYGALEVESRRQNLNEIEKQEGKNGLADYLEKRPGSAVVGPNGELYLVNGHHLAHSILDNGHNHMYVTIVADFSEMSPKKFWKTMEEKHFVYLHDENGRKRDGSELPGKIEELKNDPYRSLAWLLRKADGYKRERKVFFQEFAWANYLRQKMPGFSGGSRQDWEKAVERAMKLWSFTDSARSMPGFLGTFATDSKSCQGALASLGKNLDEHLTRIDWNRAR